MPSLLFKRFADNTSARSVAARLRRERFELFSRLIADLPSPISVLDLGGRTLYWETMLRDHESLASRLRITLLNLEAQQSSDPRIDTTQGDARVLDRFGDRSFDLVFSNSTIEHVGSFDNQRRMANELLRVGVRHYVQTPNRYFPVEPHFVFPLFHFLPLAVRVALLRRFDLGWHGRVTDPTAARELVASIRLLTRRELVQLFPASALFEERYAGMVKSFVAHTPLAR